MRARGRLARFEAVKPDPASSLSLASDHPAVVEGRSMFPSRVSSVAAGERLLISGVNNAKIGKVVEKGAWSGFPIYTLTLEERATCPRTCEQFRSCYGNAMPWPRRWDHADPTFLSTLAEEVALLGAEHPDGYVVRLHVLGDFYSPAYALFWAELLRDVPALHIYGYTARTVDDPDPESARTARILDLLATHKWSRFALRTSSSDPEVAASRAIVVENEAEAAAAGATVCPAQLSKSETCGTCGLCWASSFRGRTIAFLRHGMKRAAGARKLAAVVTAPAQPSPKPEPICQPAPAVATRPTVKHGKDAGRVAASQAADEARLIEALRKLGADKAEVEASLAVLADASGLPRGSVLFVIRRVAEAGRISVNTQQRLKGARKPNRYRILDATPPAPPSPTPTHKPAHISPPVSEKAAKPRPSETALWEKAGPVPLKPGKVVNLGDLPPMPAPAPAPPPPPLRIPPELDEAWEPDQELPPGIKPLIQLGRRQCHWPVGEPRPIQMYCADPVEGEGEYCAAHAGMMFASHRAAKRAPGGARL